MPHHKKKKKHGNPSKDESLNKTPTISDSNVVNEEEPSSEATNLQENLGDDKKIIQEELIITNSNVFQNNDGDIVNSQPIVVSTTNEKEVVEIEMSKKNEEIVTDTKDILKTSSEKEESSFLVSPNENIQTKPEMTDLNIKPIQTAAVQTSTDESSSSKTTEDPLSPEISPKKPRTRVKRQGKNKGTETEGKSPLLSTTQGTSSNNNMESPQNNASIEHSSKASLSNLELRRFHLLDSYFQGDQNVTDQSALEYLRNYVSHINQNHNAGANILMSYFLYKGVGLAEPNTTLADQCVVKAMRLCNQFPEELSKSNEEKIVQNGIMTWMLYVKGSDPISQYLLGLCYKHGIGFKKDLKESASMFQASADQGYARAQYSLAVSYHFGLGLHCDLKKAIELYHLSAEQGYDLAQVNLGGMYSKGVGVKRDLRKSRRYYQLSADQGNSFGCFNLSLLYFEGDIYCEQDIEQGIKYCRMAADKGVSEASRLLGDFYADGIGVRKDPKEAHRLYQLAKVQSNAIIVVNY